MEGKVIYFQALNPSHDRNHELGLDIESTAENLWQLIRKLKFQGLTFPCKLKLSPGKLPS